SIPGQGAQVAILSDEVWRATFAADPRVAGKILTLDDRSYTVVGVMPRGFRLRRLGPPIGGTVDTGERDLWVPIGQPGAGLGEGAINWEALGRLYPNVPIDHAVAETRRLLVGDADPAERDVRVVPRKEAETRGLGSPLVLLFGATGLLMLIACANIATLLLGEMNGRRQEVATRSALGASSRRIVRQLVTESVVLGLLGSVVGVLMAFAGTRILVALAPPIPRIDQVGVEVRVLAFASLLGMVAGLICGAMPALMSTRNAVGVVSRVSRRTTGTRRERGTQRAVVSLEIALTVVLLIAGGLLGRSLSRLFAVDPGFEAESVATVDVSLARVRYSTPEAVSEYYREVLREIAAIPGVNSASATNGLPFPGRVINIDAVEIAGRTPGPGSGEVAHRFSVAPGYHNAMGISVLAGRTITDADGPDAPRVTVISESMARRYWPDESPVGARLRYWAGEATVVGIVGDVKLQRLDANVEPTFYVPLLQDVSREFSLVTRTEGDPLRVIPLMREAIWSVDRDVPVTQASTMASLVSRSGSHQRYRTLLLLVFGVVAALLAAAGVFGVTARSVAQRAREMGIRMALGARQEGLVGGVVRSSLGTALAGTVVGVLGALWTSRLISGFLFGVEAWDPLTYGAVASLLFIVCLVASYVPARRIARIDPMDVLRAE
ncbi:MAG: FtsX-like permease family protein, partial [Gemmatimonadales bacterium]|nr:FtsX-like permease family protein [Gemmatimonadales bacterium]